MCPLSWQLLIVRLHFSLLLFPEELKDGLWSLKNSFLFYSVFSQPVGIKYSVVQFFCVLCFSLHILFNKNCSDSETWLAWVLSWDIQTVGNRKWGTLLHEFNVSDLETGLIVSDTSSAMKCKWLSPPFPGPIRLSLKGRCFVLCHIITCNIWPGYFLKLVFSWIFQVMQSQT